MTDSPAFGKPGISPTWSSSAKDLVTTALGPSRIWATLGHGIINEVYWPATGEPQIRDLGFILARGGEWTELKRAYRYGVTRPKPYIPLPRVVHQGDDYRFTLEVVPDPLRDVLLISYALEGAYQVYVLLAPRLAGSGLHNTAWVDGALFARSGNRALALVATVPFARASAGYVGASDGWQDFARNGGMTYTFGHAEDGNVALLGELAGTAGTLALGFGETPEGAHTLAVSSLVEGFEAARTGFVAGWERWGATLNLPASIPTLGEEAFLSATMLKVHEDRTFPGAVVASLSIPWGNSSDSRGGYHLVWTRDAVESAFALLAVGQRGDAERVLAYLISTQLADGHWYQNFYPDGRPFWGGVQLDEAGFPILLAAKLLEGGSLPADEVPAMVRRAAAYIARAGPASPQDRWEENAGANPFTLAVEVAALVAAAGWLEAKDHQYALSLADCWNERIEEWCYVRDTDLARRVGVPGYYVRIAPPWRRGLADRVELHNRGGETIATNELVGLEFIYLARLGLRRGDDPRILASLRVVDTVLRVGTPAGPLYHRYNDDGYGEHEDGRPFDGNGIGRAWPLLSGERGHLALLLGEDPLPYLETMVRTAGPCGLLPEQVWDTAPIPERGLFPGKPSGSSMPLLWAHAEFLKLLVARELGRPFELLRVVHDRYRGNRPVAATWHWRGDTPIERLPAGRGLLIEDARPFTLHYGFDGWQSVQERPTEEHGLGMHGVRFAPEELAAVRQIDFTRCYPEGWEGCDHRLGLSKDPRPGTP
ncbi:MAG: glycoside hydrolase family 15 protein [Gemmatimonadales bacterium]